MQQFGFEWGFDCVGLVWLEVGGQRGLEQAEHMTAAAEHHRSNTAVLVNYRPFCLKLSLLPDISGRLFLFQVSKE